MADTKISALTALLGASAASTDLAVVVDVSDTTMAASGTNKKMTLAELATAITTIGSLATDSEVTSAISVLSSTYQPLDSDLTAIAALSTTSFGRGLLVLADAAAGRTALALGTAATVDTGTGAANVPTITQADARYQPLDSDLTAIAALTTTSFGRSLLAAADAAALRTLAGVGTISTQAASSVSITGGSITGITDLAVADGGTGASDAATARTNLGVDYTTLDERTRDVIGTALVAGSNITITPNDGADTITIAASGGGGSVATDSIFDAKGDLPVGTGADTAAKLTVGTTGSILLPSSGASTGLAWAPFMAPITTGMYVQAWESGGNSNKTTTLNELVFTPIFLPHAITADRIACLVHATGTAGAVVRLGIYTASTTNGRPDALVLDAGTIDSNASTGLKEITISQAVGPGLVWLAAVSQTATCSLRMPNQNIGGFLHWNNDATGIQTPGNNRWRETGVSGALPSTATPTLGGNDYKHFNLWLRAA